MQRIRLKDGRRRRLTVREGARLQSFPDWFQFFGSETEQYNQIGNAVAPLFAWHLAKAVRFYMISEGGNSGLELDVDGRETFVAVDGSAS
jgi:DNA (cytosine-5)-methyltransferase 1